MGKVLRRYSYFIILLATVGLSPLAVRAETGDAIEADHTGEDFLIPGDPQALESGMRAGEVIRSWGPPREKIEYETRRAEYWRYADGGVLFSQGKVVKWNRDGVVPAEKVAADKAAALAQASAKADKESPAVEEILSELLEASTSSSATATTTAAVPPGMPPVGPPPMMPNGEEGLMGNVGGQLGAPMKKVR